MAPEVSVPLWCAIYLAPLSALVDTSFTLWLVGASGAYKSTITALALCHFGTFDSRHLPASWRDTGNTLERLLFTCKDLPLVIDDWAPGQDSAKSRELEAKAEYIIRAQGNRQGRQRMRADTTVRAGYPPRGLLITTGEQLPSGHSHTARIFSLEVEQPDVDVLFMGTAQDEQYFYCVAMSHYISWLKEHWQHLKETLPRRWREHRDRAQEGQSHPRMPEVIAGLTMAMELATEYALERGAISNSESEVYRNSAWDIFTRLAAKQSGRIENERPARRFLSILRAMYDQGTAVFGNKEDESPKTPVPGTFHVGWIDNNNGSSLFLLNPEAAINAVKSYSTRGNDPFTVKPEAVWRDLAREGLSICEDGRTRCRETIYGAQKRIIKLKYFLNS